MSLDVFPRRVFGRIMADMDINPMCDHTARPRDIAARLYHIGQVLRLELDAFAHTIHGATQRDLPLRRFGHRKCLTCVRRRLISPSSNFTSVRNACLEQKRSRQRLVVGMVWASESASVTVDGVCTRAEFARKTYRRADSPPRSTGLTIGSTTSVARQADELSAG